MLNLTKRVDYGLIALTHLTALRGAAPGFIDARLSVREVAATYHMSQPLLANVMKDMARLGFVRSVRGTKGGYVLSVAPETLSVGRVVEALEGPLRLTECTSEMDDAPHATEAAGPARSGALPAASAGPRPASCALSEACLIKRSVFFIHSKIRDALYGVTIADLARQAGPVRGHAAAAPIAADSARLPLVSGMTAGGEGAALAHAQHDGNGHAPHDLDRHAPSASLPLGSGSMRRFATPEVRENS